MLLYQDSVLSLEYDPATDILEMVWPDFDTDTMLETKHALQMMVESIRTYDVKKLLIDGSNARIRVSDEENLAALQQFAVDLNATRLQKIARIQSSNTRRETQTQESMYRLQASLDAHFELQNFPDRPSALTWLKLAS
ncbi:hypothetical protein [Rufibacter immobilis]|uniref:hypothetical protein n=1 Tax=Rufibacter immobilis TaxID=1348778 RepID=UPI0035E952BC